MTESAKSVLLDIGHLRIVESTSIKLVGERDGDPVYKFVVTFSRSTSEGEE